jgi:transcriptional regulator with XRE-family HTH domain
MINQIRLGARLRAARKAANFKTSKEFSKKHNVPESTYSQHESGSRQPNDDTLKLYSHAFGVNFNWLKSGKGQPYNLTSNTRKNTMAEELIDLKPLKSNSQIINSEVLATILQGLFKSFSITIPKNSIKKIAKSASQAYVKALSD